METFESFEAEEESVLEHECSVIDGGLIKDVTFSACEGGNLDDVTGIVVDNVLRSRFCPHPLCHFI